MGMFTLIKPPALPYPPPLFSSSRISFLDSPPHCTILYSKYIDCYNKVLKAK